MTKAKKNCWLGGNYISRTLFVIHVFQVFLKPILYHWMAFVNQNLLTNYCISKTDFVHTLCTLYNSIAFWNLKLDMPILTCIFFTFNWLILTSEMHFVKFHPVVASCLLSRSKRKNAPLGMRLLWKYIRNYFLVYHLISPFLLYLQNYKEFEAEILDLQ